MNSLAIGYAPSWCLRDAIARSDISEARRMAWSQVRLHQHLNNTSSLGLPLCVRVYVSGSSSHFSPLHLGPCGNG